MAKKIKQKPGLALAKVVFAPKAPGASMHPYTIARIVEDADGDPDFDARTRRRLKDKWTISKVEAMGTDTIFERLRSLDVEVNATDLPRIAEGHHSAWDASRQFSERYRGTDDEDFIGLAFCALWKRCLQSRPSIEMIDDWIVEGYRCSEEHTHDQGLNLWRRAWDTLRVRLDSAVTTTDAAERAAFTGLTSIFNWTQDYVEEHVHVSPGFVDEGAKLIDELLAQFQAETLRYRQNIAADKVAIYQAADRFDDAERAAKALIDAWPNHAIGYAMLAELARKADRRDEAIAILDRALALPVVDAREFELKQRLVHLRAGPAR